MHACSDIDRDIVVIATSAPPPPPARRRECVAGSDGSARGPSQQLWRKLSTILRRRWELYRTTLHGARRPPEQVKGVLKEPAVQLEAATIQCSSLGGGVAGWQGRRGRHHRLLPRAPDSRADGGGGGEGAVSGAVDAGGPLAVGDASRWPLAPADEEYDGAPQAPRRSLFLIVQEKEEEEEEAEGSSRRSSSWFPSCSRCSVLDIWTYSCPLSLAVVSLPEERNVGLFLGDDFIVTPLVSGRHLLHAHASVYATFGRFLRWYFYGPSYLAVACSTLFVLEEYSYVVFLGDDFRICRIQRFLVRQWIHVTASLRRRGYCLRIQRNAWSSAVHAMRQSRSKLPGGRCPCCADHVPCPLLCSTSAHGFRSSRNLWRCRSCSFFTVVDVAVIMQRLAVSRQ